MYFDNVDIKSKIEELIQKGYCKLPSLNNLQNFKQIKEEIFLSLDDKTYKEENYFHKKILKSIEFEERFFPYLKKIAKEIFLTDTDPNDSYMIKRTVRPGEKFEGYRAHFDSHLFTLVIPINIPINKNINDRGQLIFFPNIRIFRKNELINIIQKLYFKRFNSEEKINQLSKKYLMKIESFDNYEPILFLGFRTLHMNKGMNKKNNEKRITLLCHYYDTSPKYGISNILRKIRNR